MSDVVVVESPAKAKTINRYLGGGYTVLASMGHVRDLPPKDGSVRPEQDFAMDWQSDAARREARRRHRQGAERRQHAVSRHRPRPRGRGDLLAREGDAGREEGAEGRHGPPHHLQRDHPQRRARRHGSAARSRPAADRGLSGPPRAGLPGGVHALAGAVAQAAGQPLGRARAVGRAPPDLRPRGRDRGVPRPRVLDRGGRLHHAGRRAVHRAADLVRRQEARAVRPGERAGRAARQAAGGNRQVPCRLGREEARQAQPVCAVHHLDAAAGGVAQAWLRRAADHAPGAAALRGRRYRRRDHRPDHLHADRRRADGARGDRRDPRPRRGELRRHLPAIGRRASTRARSRTRRRRTRRSVRPTSRARPTASRPSCRPISAGSTN